MYCCYLSVRAGELSRTGPADSTEPSDSTSSICCRRCAQKMRNECTRARHVFSRSAQKLQAAKHQQLPLASRSTSFDCFQLESFKAADEPDAVSLVLFWLDGAATVSCTNRFMMLILQRCRKEHKCCRARYATRVHVCALQRHASGSGAGR